jgi:hypothetical protein
LNGLYCISIESEGGRDEGEYKYIEKVKLELLILNLSNIKRMFLIQVNKSSKKHKVYAILKVCLDKDNISLDSTGYKCPYNINSRRYK